MTSHEPASDHSLLLALPVELLLQVLEELTWQDILVCQRVRFSSREMGFA